MTIQNQNQGLNNDIKKDEKNLEKKDESQNKTGILDMFKK